MDGNPVIDAAGVGEICTDKATQRVGIFFPNRPDMEPLISPPLTDNGGFYYAKEPEPSNCEWGAGVKPDGRRVVGIRCPDKDQVIGMIATEK